MSSVYVRTQILNFLTTELPTENVVDMTADFQTLQDFLSYNSIGENDNWLGVQFLGFEEVPIDVLSTNTVGKYREIGSITLHVVSVASLGIHNAILTRAEQVRDKMRGQRIGPILIESVSPANFGAGITLSFEGGYVSAAITIEYMYEKNL